MFLKPVHQGRFTIERHYPAAPSRVFAAWSDVAAKSQWFGGPREWHREPHTLDFREGGREYVAGGPVGKRPVHRYDAVYHHIVQDSHIVYTYDMYMDDERMSVSLASVEFHATGSGTRLVFSEHAVFVDGVDGLASREEGTNFLLTALGTYLDGPNPHEIVSFRDFDATPEQIFAAYADPAKLARWFGPKGFTSTFHEFNFQPGGDWRFIFHGPDGTDYDNHWQFTEIIPNELVRAVHLSQPEFAMTATITREGEKARLHWVMNFPSVDVRNEVARVAVDANEQNFDRLAAELTRVS